MVVAWRYRIYGLLGTGGMGEVYRADDMKLGQAVALKFLPSGVDRDPERLTRFLNEVKIARQVSHPNVCRVYDVGEVDGHHFLSMEYVDGEDLASLLRRIGRLPRDKALQIARQLCAGLAAAHEQGVLHRDLKPANVMIDGRGRARITDFGLAVFSADAAGSQPGAGTPAYMAPEQLAGQAASVASDVHALGLVLYEVFTGKPVFKGGTLADLLRLKTGSTPTSPSALVDHFDPAVERVLLRCLATEPRQRPATVMMVAAALPGGDPLAAAIAAGETPSPEMVAEAGGVGGLRPLGAGTLLASFVVAICLVVLLAGKTQLSRIVPLPKPPDVLVERARDLLRTFGHVEPARDSLHRFEYVGPYVDHLVESVPAPAIWDRLGAGPPFAIDFWYRQSPLPLVPYDLLGVEYRDPPPIVGGMAGVVLEPDGRLRRLDIVPPEQDDAEARGVDPPWALLFKEAGLDLAGFTPAKPSWSPPTYGDSRMAWEGAYPTMPDVKIRVEAAGYHGRPISFRIIGPWTRPAATAASSGGLGLTISRILAAVAILAILIGGALLARRNVRLGRGDRRGASRLALFMLAVLWLEWVLWTHHVASQFELWIFFRGLGECVLYTCFTWVCYLAIEPYVRRTWPEVLVSWVRLLEGRPRDSLVGRDVLLGLAAGSVVALLSLAWPLGSRWLGWPAPAFDEKPYWMEFQNLTGLRIAFANLMELAAAVPLFSVAYLVSLLLLRALLRKQSLAVTGYVLFWSIVASLASPHPVASLIFMVIHTSLTLAILLRVGFLASMVSGFTGALLRMYSLTFDPSAWYAGNTVLVLLVLAGFAVYGFRVSLGNRPVLVEAPLSD